AGWRSFMSAVTHTADNAVLLAAALVAVGLLLWRRNRRGAAFLLATPAAATAVRLTVLHPVHRPRPPHPLTATPGFAYPSGHTTSSAVAAGVIVALGWSMLRGRRSRVALAGLASAWAALVGVSRVALVAHWPTDILGGWLLAVAATSLLAVAF